MNPEWPWLAFAGLGAFHGLNPAMGWVFAVALGMHRQSRAAVLLAVSAIAAGHAASILMVALSFVLVSTIVQLPAAHFGAGLLLIGCAAALCLFGHRQRVRIGMTTGLAGLALWSFVMTTAHGAGLMLLPALMPLCLGDSPAAVAATSSLGAVTFAAVMVHAGAMLAVTGAIALVVYQGAGLAVQRMAWINFDGLWIGALAVTGMTLVLVAL
jgi:hypothetical protein